MKKRKNEPFLKHQPKYPNTLSMLDLSREIQSETFLVLPFLSELPSVVTFYCSDVIFTRLGWRDLWKVHVSSSIQKRCEKMEA